MPDDTLSEKKRDAPDGQKSTGNIPPPTEGFIEELERVPNYPRRWRSAEGRVYTWDSLHGEFEMFNKSGRHLGAANAKTGAMIKPAVPGRKLDG